MKRKLGGKESEIREDELTIEKRTIEKAYDDIKRIKGAVGLSQEKTVDTLNSKIYALTENDFQDLLRSFSDPAIKRKIQLFRT